MATEIANSGLTPVAYYKFTSGALTTDSSGNGYTLTNVGSTPSGTGLFAGAADLGASNSTHWFYVNTNYGVDGDSMTIYMWVKLRTEIGAGTYKFTVPFGNNTSKTYFKIEYNYGGGTRNLTFTRVKAGVAAQSVSYNVTLGTANWHQIVFTYDTTNMRGYLDGALVAGPTAASGSGSSAVSAVSFFGNGSTGVADDASSVLFDDVALFNTALTGTQILDLYNGRSLALSPGTFTFSGIASALLYGRKLIVSVGTFILTGIAVALEKGLGILAGTGVFILSGSNATLSAVRQLAVSVGEFTLTGIDVALSITKTLVAATGSFILTGYPATLVKRLGIWVIGQQSNAPTYTESDRNDTDVWTQGTKP